MPLTNYEIISIMLLGVVFLTIVFQTMVMIISPRKNLHFIFIVSFLSLGFILGFNPHYGIWRDLWPYDVVKNLLFIAVNFFVMGVNFVFVVMPKYRKGGYCSYYVPLYWQYACCIG